MDLVNALIRTHSCNTLILLYPANSCRILLYAAIFCCILPYRAVSCRILPYPAVFCRIVRYPAFPAVICRMPPDWSPNARSVARQKPFRFFQSLLSPLDTIGKALINFFDIAIRKGF